MSDEDEPVPGPEAGELRALLVAWIETDTWHDSQAFCEAHAEQLLSGAAWQEFQAMLGEVVGNGEEAQHRHSMLRQHLRLLAAARSTSIVAAYEPLLHPVLPENALESSSPDMRAAIQALFDSERPSDLIHCLTEHPILLEGETETALVELAEQLYEAEQELAAGHL